MASLYGSIRYDSGSTDGPFPGRRPSINPRRVKLNENELNFYLDQVKARATFNAITSPEWKGRRPGLEPFSKITSEERDIVRQMMRARFIPIKG